MNNQDIIDRINSSISQTKLLWRIENLSIGKYGDHGYWAQVIFTTSNQGQGFRFFRAKTVEELEPAIFIYFVENKLPENVFVNRTMKEIDNYYILQSILFPKTNDKISKIR